MPLNINVNSEESSNNDFLIVFDAWGQRPNRIIIHDTFIGNDFENLISKLTAKEYRNLTTLTELLPNNDTYTYNQRVLIEVNENIFLSFVKVNLYTENYLIDDLCIYYKSQEQKSELDNFIQEISDCIVDQVESDIEKINTLEIVGSNLELSPIFFQKSDYTIETLYSTKSLKRVKKLIKNIKSLDKGLSIIYGDKGVGKTNLSKYISSKVDRISIYIPINLVESSINNPEFRNFIKKYDRPLLIIDDCEFLYNPIYGKTNYFSSNIIQLVDGFLSDELQLQILLLFNVEDEEDLDDILLDSNSLIDSVEIDYIDAEQSTELSKEIGHNKKYKNSSRLVDVFKNNSDTKKNNIGL